VGPVRTLIPGRDLRDFEARFKACEDFVYGIFNSDESEVFGGSGLHPRIGPGALEIGYWIRGDQVGKGFATETTRALTTAGLTTPGVTRIEIHCDPDNTASRRIPERLGFRLVEIRSGDKKTSSGGPRDTMVFEMMAATWNGT